jgi:hypothetical protein
MTWVGVIDEASPGGGAAPVYPLGINVVVARRWVVTRFREGAHMVSVCPPVLSMDT